MSPCFCLTLTHDRHGSQRLLQYYCLRAYKLKHIRNNSDITTFNNRGDGVNKLEIGRFCTKMGIMRSVSQLLSVLIYTVNTKLVHLPCESLYQIHTTQEKEFSILEREFQRSSDLQSPIVQTLPLSTENIGKLEVN